MENGRDASLGGNSYPWLVFLSGEKLEHQVFCDVIREQKTNGYKRSTTELMTNVSVIMPTNIDGWFLLAKMEDSKSYSDLCLWNVFTLQSINLPSVDMTDYNINYVLLTKSLDDLDCVVLLVLDDPIGILYYDIVSEEDFWTFRDYREDLINCSDDSSSDEFAWHIVCDDKIFMISRYNVLAKIETKKPKRLIIRPDLSFPTLRPYVVGPCFGAIRHWVACCGDIYVIHMILGGHDWKQKVSIELFKLEFSDMSWNMVDSCPNIAFFVNDRQCLACSVASADSSTVGNRVYIVNDDDDGDDEEEETEGEGEDDEKYGDDEKKDIKLLLHIYHIQEKTLTTSLISPPNNESISFWMLVPNNQACIEVVDDNHNERARKKVELFVKGEHTGLMVAHKTYEDDEKKFSKLLDDLPIEILKTILSFLINPSDYMNFRATSRSFRNAFSAKEWKNIKTSINDSIPSPWLISCISLQVGKCVFSMVDPILRNKFYVRASETFEENSRICCSANGWLLMSSPSNIFGELNLFFYNPVTKSTIHLSKLDKHATHFFLGCSEVVGISVDLNPTFCTLAPVVSSVGNESNIKKSDREWELEALVVEYDNDKFKVQQSNVNAVFVGGIYYFIVGKGNIAYFSKVDYTLRMHTLEEPCIKSSYEQYFLAECDEELLSIYIGKKWKWLRAFKFNRSHMIWDEVKELKSNNLYLSYVSSTTSKPQLPQAGNRIYFSRFYQDSIVYYSFNTQKFHISDGQDSVMSDCDGLKEQMYSCWIHPSWNGESKNPLLIAS